ncbi:glycoside hydrolase family 3 protein [Paenibacillus sp. XY044]|uniref:glycoside hydrolase family 3 protein n=1 Tax=Paenibacillus sp. XY044 TaxID=2026089 RepID=UPI000B99ACC5|nr:glycoside hydrolase family 3 protein [Paenibacillus sp. XY044]OZB97688.1 beta-glucosidase [Paenibacillus sp. XY044]
MQTSFTSLPFWDHSLPLEERVADLVSRLTTEEKIALIPTRQAAVERLGIPAYNVGGEAAHGVAWIGEATVFPQPIGLACSWDEALMQKVGSAIGDEARVFHHRHPQRHGLTLWAPTVDLERDPRWGRTEEAYGEDPHLTGKLASSLVRGMQGDHPFYLKMVATLKHFFANNNEVDRLTFSSSIDPRNMHEYYLKAFEKPFTEGGAYSMMTAYNSINGTPAIESPYVKRFVKGEWKMPGFIVCDGGDLSQTVDYHKYHQTHAQSVAGALKAGVDCLTDEVDLVIGAVREALGQGLIAEADLDLAIRNIFRVRMKLGQFDPPELNPYASIPKEALMSPDHAELSLQAAKKSVVLLKNEGNLLPLDKKRKVSVIGPLGNAVYTDWYSGTLPYAVTPYQGIAAKLPEQVVPYADGDDVVKLKQAGNGWSVVPGADSDRLLTTVPQGEREEDQLFRHRDWGYGSHTFQSVNSGLYVTEDENHMLRASSERIWGWFVKEVLRLGDRKDGTFALKTWNDRYVGVVTDEWGQAVLQSEEDTSADEAQPFAKETVKDGLDEAVRIAKESDTAIVIIGNNPFVNGKEEVDRPGIGLPEAQGRLVREVCRANPRTVVVIVGSYPFALGDIADIAPAILFTSHAGQELGNALADVLFGDENPGGRLNMTWYESEDQLPDFLDYDIIKGRRTYMYFEGKPLYPFGHGLSYTDFKYSDLSLVSAEVQAGGLIQASVQVTNTGSVTGDEVVQLYVKSGSSRVKMPRKQLQGFKRITLAPGESQTVSFELPVSELAVWDVTRDRFCVQSGTYELMVGASSDDIRLASVIRVDGETIPNRDLSLTTFAENYDDYEGIVLDECLEGRTAVRTAQGKQGWIAFHDAEFNREAYSALLRVSGGTNGGGISIRIGSPEGMDTAKLAVQAGDSQRFDNAAVSVRIPSGVHSIYLCLEGTVRISRFSFEPGQNL